MRTTRRTTVHIALAGAAAVALLASACGQYPNVHARAYGEQQAGGGSNLAVGPGLSGGGGSFDNGGLGAPGGGLGGGGGTDLAGGGTDLTGGFGSGGTGGTGDPGSGGTGGTGRTGWAGGRPCGRGTRWSPPPRAGLTASTFAPSC